MPIKTAVWLWSGLRVLPCAVCPVACAGGPWDGRWFYDSAASHLPSHGYTLQKLSNGWWRRDDGDSSYVEASPTGATTQHWQQLSADSATIADRVSRVNANGRRAQDERTCVRVGDGAGFEGRWKTVPKPYVAPPGPFWVISSLPDGTMTWTIPFTGEVLHGKADGQSRAITGPEFAPGSTFVWKQTLPDRLEFYASKDGRLVEIAIETLSPDGKTFTDTLWSASREDEKRISVYHKE